MLKKEDQEIIERYLKGTATDQEARYVESLFAEGESDLLLRHFVHKDWEENNAPHAAETGNAALESILDRIHTVIDQDQEKRSPWSRALNIYMKVAAVLLIPLMGLTALYLTRVEQNTTVEKTVNEVYAPMGARATFELPDGTRGTLNSGSTLTYEIPFNANRVVKLEGEAWFEVTHDAQNPFRVVMDDCSVEVLGTSFNVNAYPDVDFVEVVLAEGRVNFITAKNEGIPMMPSERLMYSRGVATKSAANPEPYRAWTEGKLIFRGDAMAEVVRRLERWYHVDIRVADKALEEYSFFATFQDDSLDEVLRFLSMTSPMNYKILPQSRTSDGEIKKREVILYSTKK